MGWFDSLFRRSGAGAELDSDAVRALLFDAVQAGDASMLARVCEEHESVVLAHFAEWQKVPAEYRTPDKLSWYGPGLIAVAQHFAAKRSHPELLASLAPPRAQNPLVQWQEGLAQLDAGMREGHYKEGAETARAMLERASSLQGSGVDAYLPVTYGKLGECLFHSGDAEGAVGPTEKALSLCETQGDQPGVVAYLGNLYEIHRYRGDAGAAGRFLARLGDALERQGDSHGAGARRRQLAIVVRGEPLCRVIVEMNGREYEVSDAPKPTGRTRFLFVRNRIALRPSTLAVADGVRAAESGNFVAALACFERAAVADPFDPWPRYHQGGALLDLERYREAAETLEATERLAPGFYHCRSDKWLAESLAGGTLEHGTFRLVRQIVDGKPDAEQAVRLARGGLEKSKIGLLYLALGDALCKLRRTSEADDAYRRGLEIAEEPDVRTRLLAGLGSIVGDEAEKLRLLQEAIGLRGNLVAAAMSALLIAAQTSAN
jgi:tetratricopeptide (TPR) repeat protein